MDAQDGVRIAMWSGPRNISTAMLRSFANRPDTFVCDEPLYAHYLAVTRKPHPGAEEIIASHDPAWQSVVAGLIGPIPGGHQIYYQKQMAHHLLPMIDRSWLEVFRNAFLIRHPREMLPSLAKVTPDPGLEDTGLPQQLEIFDKVRRETGAVPPVLDSKDVLEDPRTLLTRLCEALSIPVLDEMFSWPAGAQDTDGVWAKHWYDSVNRSTGFQPYRPKTEHFPEALQDLLAECLPIYEELYAHRLTSG